MRPSEFEKGIRAVTAVLSIEAIICPQLMLTTLMPMGWEISLFLWLENERDPQISVTLKSTEFLGQSNCPISGTQSFCECSNTCLLHALALDL